MLRSTTLLIGSLFATGLFSQVSYGGRALGLYGPELPEVPTVRMPLVDAEAMKAEDEDRAAQGIKGPFRYGKNHPVDLSLENSGIWHTLRNHDRVWRIAIQCPEALTVSFQFHEYVVPEGGRIFVYNDAGQQLGAFTAESAPGFHSMGVQQLQGDRITIEYHEPVAVAGQGRLRIGQVTHGYRDLWSPDRDFGDSGSCNINVICPEGVGWEDEIRSVALIDAGGGYCTGSMINNCAQDSTPYFLTADHCLGGGVTNWIFRWNWDSPSCDPTENAPTNQTISGSTLLVNSGGTDVALLELSGAPPSDYNVHYTGWDRSTTPAQAMTGIHHPRGDIKKISHSDGPAVTGTFSGADCWRVQVWSDGTTEPGSSGSGLWNQDHRLVGQLFGGAANCANSVDDYYGKLSTSWPLLEPFLGACGDTLNGWTPGEVIFIPDTNDAAVTSISGVPSLLCETQTIQPNVTLKNNSNSVMVTMTITYGLVGGAFNDWIWTGSLQPGQTVAVTLPQMLVPAGEHILSVSCSLPNGSDDPMLDNNTWTFPFTVSFPAETILLALTPDNFGSDITWELSGTLGTVLYGGGPYSDNNSGITDTIQFCLTEACYTFTIFDEFGDGICCQQGDGHYEIFDTHGNQYVSNNGQYTTEHSDNFCVVYVGVNELNGLGNLALYPNPNEGAMTVTLSGINGPSTVSIIDGIGRQVVSERIGSGVPYYSMDLSGLTNGVYMVQVQHAEGRLVQRMIIQR